MKIFSLQVTAIFLELSVLNASATPRYVDLNSPSPTPPFTDWSIAATNIQDAIDAAGDGDLVWVTNGVYSYGGKVMAGDLTNRVALDKAVTVQSVNGPWVTTIQGGGTPSGSAAVRCAWLTNGAFLTGFTLKWGATRTSGTAPLLNGGGVWCASSNAIVANCIIKSNTAFQFGGGAYQGTLNSCLISSNATTAGNGAAVCNATLNNCTVVSNSGIGIYQTLPNLVWATNCIVYFNLSGNYAGGALSFSYCSTTPALTGIGNFTNAPQLFADGVHLTSGSPCIGTGANPVTGTDIFGMSWANPPSVGCAEFDPSPLVTKPQIQLTSDPVGFTIGKLAVCGQPPFTFWWLKDGVTLQDNGHFSFTQSTNLVATGVSLADAGNYQLVVSNATCVVTSAEAQLVIHCVDVASANPVAPYSTWTTAATNIQDAITVSAAGEIVLVTNGLYAVGGKSMDGVITNRVSVDKAILVQSANGSSATIIQGAWDPTITNGPASVRGVWMTNAAVMSGFTIRGGSTRTVGGGVFGAGTNTPPGPAPSTNTIIANCLIEGNSALDRGGGAYNATLLNCVIKGNIATSSGGGAYNCILKNCLINRNSSVHQGGGCAGVYSILKNCAITQNRSILEGSGAYNGMLVNCTVSGNVAGGYASQSGAVANATLSNCIVFGNLTVSGGFYTNYYICTFSYSDTDPLPSGSGNIDVDPQLFADGFHLTAASPCIATGTAGVLAGTDIDGQPWNNPPSIGCDEWQPVPVIGAQPVYQINFPAHGLTFNVVAAGQTPFTFFWNKDGALIQDDPHHINSGTANLIVNNFGPDDAGNYQVVVSNTFGVVTSAVAQVVIHAVDATGVNPVPPFSTWATAATNIQDAINIAAAGDIVLVTNGVYATGGKVEAGDLTNRVAVDKPITVTSVKGYAATVIQGAWDPATTNGPLAVRCAWLTNGATLNGFTLQNGATRATGDSYSGGPLESGGGIWCVSTNGIVSNCLLTNNTAIYGGGISYGTLNNCLVVFNLAVYGGGAYYATLNNCTVLNNYTTTIFPYRGGGTYDCVVRNSIVLGNADNWPSGFPIDNYYYDGGYFLPKYSYSCTYPLISGIGNIDGNSFNPQILDWFHIASTSPCRGAGSALYASGTDLDGEPWANPPSMGCDEVILSNLVGPLSVSIFSYQTNLLVNRPGFFSGMITGRASRVEWSFGDGPTVTNLGAGAIHQWTNTGDYAVTFTAFNTDNPAGVSTNFLIHVLPLNPPQLQAVALVTNGFRFQFTGQTSANYTVQYTTNLAPPATWQTLQNIYYSNGGVHQITDSTVPNGTRFYRVLAQ
jgi:hypothetical protein